MNQDLKSRDGQIIIVNKALLNLIIQWNHIKNYFLENKTQFNKFDIIQFIRNNIKNSDNRYLLLITHSNLNQYLIWIILKENQDKKNIIYYLGSLFEEDIYNETYTSKQITKIRYYLFLKSFSTSFNYINIKFSFNKFSDDSFNFKIIFYCFFSSLNIINCLFVILKLFRAFKN